MKKFVTELGCTRNVVLYLLTHVRIRAPVALSGEVEFQMAFSLLEVGT